MHRIFLDRGAFLRLQPNYKNPARKLCPIFISFYYNSRPTEIIGLCRPIIPVYETPHRMPQMACALGLIGVSSCVACSDVARRLGPTPNVQTQAPYKSSQCVAWDFKRHTIRVCV